MLVVKGYIQMEGVDYDEAFTHMARLDAIRLLIAYAAHKGFKLYQMDVNTTFLNGYLNEEVFVEQTLRFEDTSLLEMCTSWIRRFMDSSKLQGLGMID